MLVELLRRRASDETTAVAIEVDGGPSLTFEAWDRRSDALTRGLRARGVGVGARVVLMFDRRHWTDLAVAYAGVHKAGGVAVLLSPGWGSPAPGDVVADCGAAAVIAPPDLVGTGANLSAPAEVVTPAELEHGNERGNGAEGVDVAASPDDEAELLYRSGPLCGLRPVRRSHRDATTPRRGHLIRTKGPGTLVHAFPVTSAAASDALWLVLAAAGRRCVTVASFEPASFCALVARERASGVGLTPALAATVVAAGAAEIHDLSSVAEVVLAEGRARPALLTVLERAFPSASVTVADPGTEEVLVQPAPVVAPVAFSQEGMLWHEQFAPGCQNLPPLARRYRGALDVEALERALSEIVRRHQPLRTTFELRDGQPVQAVGRPPARVLTLRDLRASAGDQQEAALRRAFQEAARPFDLVGGPLFQPTLYRLGDDDHVLVIRTHHTVFDDWSVGVFRRELSSLYTAFAIGGGSPLEALPVNFSEFVRAQRRRLTGAEGARQHSYWRRRLDGAPLALQLAIGHPDRPPGSHQPSAAPITVDLSPEIHAGVRALARRQRATSFMTLLAAFQVLLHHRTGQDDLLLSSVVANRNRQDVEGLIGCFSKKVLLRLRAPEDLPFTEVLAGARVALLEALANQDLAFETVLQEALGAEAAEHGLVPYPVVLFQGVTPEPPEPVLPGLASSGFDTSASTRRRHFMAGDEGGAPRKERVAWGAGLYSGTFLILSVVETEDRLSLVARGAFHLPLVEDLLASFQTLLADVVAHPDRTVSELAAPLPDGIQHPDPTGPVVSLRGFSVNVGLIETALAGCAGVSELALAVRDVAGRERLVAYVVADGEPPALTDLQALLWRRLPGYAWPAVLVVLPGLPRRPGGTIDRAALPTPETPASQPGPTEERMLAAAWADVAAEEVVPEGNYWQSFSFLEAAAVLAGAGVSLTAPRLSRNRTLRTLALDLSSTDAAPNLFKESRL